MFETRPITQFAFSPTGLGEYPPPDPVEPDSEPPQAAPPTDQPPAGDALYEVATSFQEVRLRGASDLASWPAQFPEHAAHVGLFLDLHRSDPEAAHRLAQAVVNMPEAGTEFLGFHLIAELGRGALGRVFLARQGELADRQVVLKVSPEVRGETQTLAQLQHTNVVPLYSTHRAGPLHAVCMPFFGSTTLADVVRDVRGRASLPDSGKELVSTLIGRKSTVTTDPPSERPSERPAAPAAVPQGGRATPVLEMLQKLSYVQAVLWLASRLADGLAHAHERGILHRDLKPANVLLTDDGQPMLLDFNLAQDTKLGYSPAAAQIGGTLPFMAPEQLRAYQLQDAVLNFNSDLYALGVILYELLTGRHPFPAHCGPMNQVLERMIQDRQQPPPGVRQFNAAASPAVESIVRRLLEPDPARRYQTARELHEDLDRQLKDLPLKYAPETSPRERLGKWVRRHPRLTSMTTAVAAGIVLLSGLAGLLVGHGQKLARLEAKETLGRFRDGKRDAEFLLATRMNDLANLARGESAARAALDTYRVLEDQNWGQAASVRRLPDEERDRLGTEVGELLVLTARAVALRAQNQTGPQRDAALLYALALNERAEACQGPDGPSRVLWEQRAELVGLLGRGAEAQAWRERAASAPLRTATDRYLAAVEMAAHGRLRDALPLLREATAAAPQDFRVWFLLGLCHYDLAQCPEAVGCFNTCIALSPNFPWAHFNRGMARLRQQDYRQALVDFDETIRLSPDATEAFYQRALTRQKLADYRGADADLTKALELGAAPVQILVSRASVRGQLGDAEGARRDRAEGLRLVPNDELGWAARGYARMETEPAAALADFNEALRLNPRSLACLQNKAHVLSKLGRTEEALATLDKAVELYPDFINARAGRAIMLARLGRREAAHREAGECLLCDQQPLTFYQVADVFALTSLKQPNDRKQAFRLLSKALERGCGFDLLDKDKDLDAIRNTPEFRELVAAARVIRTGATNKAPQQ